jgi:hypothetical protein
MDYLVYAYLQIGRFDEARQIIQQLNQMRGLDWSEFKSAYAASAMPIRFAVERAQWVEAASISPPPGAPLHVIALAIWARGLGLVREGEPGEAQAEADRLQDLEDQLRTEQQEYWSVQTGILRNEILGWIAEANRDPRRAASLLHACADQEDAIEKLPVTPGPSFPRANNSARCCSSNTNRRSR